jgi:hypothetical protein
MNPLNPFTTNDTLAPQASEQIIGNPAAANSCITNAHG